MRPALRLAWREIIRHRVRSLLVLVLIGLPILASVSAVTLIETGEISAQESHASTFGSAQTLVEWGSYGFDPVDRETPVAAISQAEATKRLREVTTLPFISANWRNEWLAEDTRGWGVSSLHTDFTSPQSSGLAELISGRLPTSGSEIAVSPRLAHGGASVGRHLTLAGHTVTVVGVARSFAEERLVDNAVFVSSAEVMEESGDSTTYRPDRGWTFLVGTPTDPPLSLAAQDALANAGFSSIQEEDGRRYASGVNPSAEDVSLISLLITCLLIEIVLLAGPAFAVGVRRQRHSLALLAVAGGSPRDIRRTVAAQGLILGLVASIIGAVLSIPLTWLILWLLERGWGLTLGPFDIGGIAIAPAIVLGTLSAVLACVIPARQAAQADVVTALSGRQPTPRVRRGWPIAGALVFALGTLGSLRSLGQFGGDLANAWWAVVSVCGAVMLTPWLIAAIARVAPRLGLPFRIALRDADRHRSRSAPAIAAVMASVSAVVAIGIGSASEDRRTQNDYFESFPVGTTTLWTSSADPAAVLAAIKERTGVTFTPLRTLGAFTLEAAVDVAPAESDVAESRQPGRASSVVIADQATLAAWGVTLSAKDKAAIASGKALVDRAMASRDGEVTVTSWSDDSENPIQRSVPAIVTDLAMAGEMPPGSPRAIVAGLVIPTDLAAKLRLSPGAGESMVAIADRPAREIDEAFVEATARSVGGSDAYVEVASFPTSYYWLILLLLSGLGGFVVLLGTFTATGLALDDARADLTTLSAVGARPRTRRIVAGAHAFLIAFIGAVLGVAVGFTPGMAASWLLTAEGSHQNWIFVVPWPLLGALLVGLPLLAGLLTAATSRTRPLIPRSAG